MKPGGKIGFLDSGLGGLITMRAIVKQLPQYNYIYLGDTAHKPYGPKPASDIRGYVQRGVSFLFDQGCELVVLTSNTASAQALAFVQNQFLPAYAPRRHVLGVVLPAAEAAVMATHTNRIGVLATQGTVEAHAFAEEIQELRPEATVLQQVAPELVMMIESGLHQSQEMSMFLRHYLQPLMDAKIDTLILGCSHYELIATQITQIVGLGVTLISDSKVMPDSVQDFLFRHSELSHKLTQGSERRFFYTSNPDVFAGMSQSFYGEAIVAEEAELA